VYQELCVRLDYDPHLVKATAGLAHVDKSVSEGRVGQLVHAVIVGEPGLAA